MEELDSLPIEECVESSAETQQTTVSIASPTRKPRAIIIKATNKDFDELTDLVKSKFPDIQILYITTGPASSILRVTKTMPLELQSIEQPLYSVE